MRYCEIRKEMSSLYFALDIFFQFEAKVPEYDAMYTVHCTLCTVHSCWRGQGLLVNSVTFWDSSLRKNAASGKSNDGIALQISQCLISAYKSPATKSPDFLSEILALNAVSFFTQLTTE